MANNYDINYDDKRFTEVEADKNAALKENEKLYSGMANESNKYYQAQIDASKQWADTQTKLQNEQTEFAVEKIEQQKDQAHKDYLKEQSGAYTDWQKQSNQYGANSEQVAAQGLANTGYSESSQVSMYNTYQNRVATAREAYSRAVLNYDNAIKDAQLQNNSILAEIAYKALEQQLTLSLEGFQYKNNLLLEQANKKLEIDQMYHSRYQDVLDQMNTENALAEQIRQYNEKMAEEKRQYNESLALQQAQLAEEKRQFNETMAYNKSRASGSGGGSGGKTKANWIYGGSSGGGQITGGSRKITSPKTKTNKQKVTEYLDSGENRPKVDTKSLVKAGYAGRSAESIDKAVRSGVLIEEVKNGKLTYTKAFRSGGKSNFSLKTQTKQKF